MTQGVQVWFYHLERTALKDALPDILEKVLERGLRAYVRGEGDDRLSELDQALWASKPESFLAHGLETEDHAERQPILIGSSEKAVNNADILISVSAMNLPDLSGYKRCLIMFEGQDDAHLGWARQQWKQLKSQSFDLAYWKQNEHGKWERAQ
ncbi:MAG: DNA polymerase III subunit chi [Asticcacaulis sp.]